MCNKLFFSGMLILASFAIAGGVFAQDQLPPALDQIKKNFSVQPIPREDDLSVVRAEALREKAQALGAQAGLARRSAEILSALAINEKSLDRLFNMGPLVIEGKVLPPVVVETRDAVAINEPDVIRTSERIFRIERQERFFTVLPTWRDYLYVGLQPATVNELHPQMMPRDESEKQLWDHSLERGWKQGVEQADAIYSENMARLEKDYAGMIRYLLLCAKGMITRPVIAASFSLVTGDKKEMAVNDTAYKITEKTGLEVDSKRWSPVIRHKSKNDVKQ